METATRVKKYSVMVLLHLRVDEPNLIMAAAGADAHLHKKLDNRQSDTGHVVSVEIVSISRTKGYLNRQLTFFRDHFVVEAVVMCEVFSSGPVGAALDARGLVLRLEDTDVVKVFNLVNEKAREIEDVESGQEGSGRPV